MVTGGRWGGIFCLVVRVVLPAGCATSKPVESHEEAPRCRCTPDRPCWPSPAEWRALESRLTGTLERPEAPLLACRTDAGGDACAAAVRGLKNPFRLQDQSGSTQSTGWLDAWTAAPSAHAVAVENAADVAAAVAFAREHRLRLVVKGTGHDYKGRSSAPDSLLVWTHRMRRVTVHDAFVPQGCPESQAAAAVTVEAGTRWLEAYQAVTVEHGRYVQGGGCTSVGAAGGFTQGGGFGSWSRKYGTAAASMLEAEVVTADGVVRTVNACQNRELFWALRGGGGGTFGVVTRVTLMTHPLPNYFGIVSGSIAARSDAAFVELIEHFLTFHAASLNDEHWGEQVRVRGDNTLELSMVFQGMSAAQAEEVWRPLRAWVDGRADRLTMSATALEIPGTQMWNRDFLAQHRPQAIVADDRPDQPGSLFWWAGDQEQVSTYWHAYQSRWIPLDLFQASRARAFASSLFDASRHWSVGLHFNKGLAGASPDAIQRTRETSMNPAVYRAAALAIVAASSDGHPGEPGHEPDRARAEAERASVSAAMKIIREATPGAGTYVNESDYFEPDWQREFWGENYAALLAIKRKVDPEGLFYCHHCVGSESWSEGGMCPRADPDRAR